MGLFDKLRGEFVDIIEWLDSTNDTIAYRFERYNNQIKMGAKLTVRPGQLSVFVNEGQVGDIFQPGMYTLSTQNLPLLSTLQGWQYGFNSPFKAEVYFFSTKIFTNLKWGTSNPITIRDPELGPVRLRAYGNYSIRVTDPGKLLQELVSTDGLFQVDEISDHLRNTIITSFISWVGRNNTPLLDFAAQYREMGDRVRDGIQPEIKTYGIELTQLLIENISLPPEVEAALDKRASIGLLGNLQQYTQYQAANAIEQSAQNPGGGNAGLDFGVGMVMAQQMANSMQSPPAPPLPPPIQTQWYISHNGQRLGPFTTEQLEQQGLTAQTNLWRAGMQDWQQASALPELSSYLAAPPPPPPVQIQWYISHNGQRLGPFTPEQLVQQGLTTQTYVWRGGMQDWQPASQVSELASLLASVPPPPM
ncbi:membrane protease subunit, stomatin/prohibitin family protein [Cylindrospermum sp. NIES-4074]|nr:membrane protease subunit, stomatin/prohibitin family protein [Cylindrospermum sp. NIES-4074]